MTAHRCAYCRAQANMKPVYLSSTSEPWGGGWRSRVAVVCDNCAEVMVVVGSTNGSLDRGQTTTEDVAHLLRFGHWLPTSVGQYEFEHVPEHIARAAEEAHQAAEVGTHMAALLMARTTVEATAKDKGILKGSLFEKIDRLRDDAHIRSNIAEAAHQIRHLGNDMAHGDLDDAPDKEDVTDVLTLMDALLREVYETSAITSRIINRRQG